MIIKGLLISILVGAANDAEESHLGRYLVRPVGRFAYLQDFARHYECIVARHVISVWTIDADGEPGLRSAFLYRLGGRVAGSFEIDLSSVPVGQSEISRRHREDIVNAFPRGPLFRGMSDFTTCDMKIYFPTSTEAPRPTEIPEDLGRGHDLISLECLRDVPRRFDRLLEWARDQQRAKELEVIEGLFVAASKENGWLIGSDVERNRSTEITIRCPLICVWSWKRDERKLESIWFWKPEGSGSTSAIRVIRLDSSLEGKDVSGLLQEVSLRGKTVNVKISDRDQLILKEIRKGDRDEESVVTLSQKVFPDPLNAIRDGQVAEPDLLER